MLKHLKLALPCLITAKHHYNHALSRRHYPTLHEDIDHAINDLKDLIAALQRGETLPR